MQSSAILVNTVRRPILDEAALVAALEGRVIATAGLDVHEKEPQLPPGLRALGNVVLPPHIGSAGQATRDAMGMLAVGSAQAVPPGGEPLTPVAGRATEHCTIETCAR